MKKKILILGYSSFVKRRILNSLRKIKNLEIYICSKSNKIKNKYVIFDDYEKALNTKRFDFVYISLINTLHYKYALLALKKGNNVIVDKPITTSFNQTIELIKIAKKKKLFLCELTIFNYHICFEKILKKIGGKNNIEIIQSNFNIPLTNRLSDLRKLKKSCNYDMGPYIAAMIRIFLSNELISKVVYKSFYKKPYSNIVKDLSVLVKNKKQTYFGNFGTSKEYLSKIIFFTKNKIVEIPFQAFALPCNKYISVMIKSNNKKTILKYKDDYIQRFFKDLIKNNLNKNYFYKMIEIDNKIKKKLNLFQ